MCKGEIKTTLDLIMNKDLEKLMKSISFEVKDPKPELTMCPIECENKGEFSLCYFDLYQSCPIYRNTSPKFYIKNENMDN